jgi:hypothetical protein
MLRAESPAHAARRALKQAAKRREWAADETFAPHITSTSGALGSKSSQSEHKTISQYFQP